MCDATEKKVAAFLVAACVLIGIYLGGYLQGRSEVKDKWDKAIAQQAQRAAEVQTQQATATEKIVVQYVDRVKTIRQQGETIVKEVPVYVSKTSDDHCVVPVGFVSVHDSAASGAELPDSTGAANETPSGITLSEVSATVATNYQSCRETAEQLTELQSWVAEMKKATE